MTIKQKMFPIRMSDEQLKILEAKANHAGFRNKSDYIRYVLFMPQGLHEKIDAIYNKIFDHEQRKSH